MLMVISMMDTGLMIRLMELVFTNILMEHSMKANGKKINNTETVWKHGLMEPSTMVNTYRARKMV